MSVKDPCGAVLVCGGGIAGIQATLDLSAAGFRVYLVEQSPTIGGQMARLDKTFPTGDCATCIISPKLVECMRNHNIDIVTMADLVGLEGEPGDFRVKVRKRPRGVDPDKCTGCGDCWQYCMVRNIPVCEPSETALEEIDKELLQILKRHEGEAGALMPVLQEINEVYGYLPKEIIEQTACALKVSSAMILRVASFYHEFRFEPATRHLVEVCNGTSCYAQGSNALYQRVKDEIDGLNDPARFELRTVRCLGLCALSPSMKIDGTGFSRIDPDQVPKILEQFE